MCGAQWIVVDLTTSPNSYIPHSWVHFIIAQLIQLILASAQQFQVTSVFIFNSHISQRQESQSSVLGGWLPLRRLSLPLGTLGQCLLSLAPNSGHICLLLLPVCLLALRMAAAQHSLIYFVNFNFYCTITTWQYTAAERRVFTMGHNGIGSSSSSRTAIRHALRCDCKVNQWIAITTSNMTSFLCTFLSSTLSTCKHTHTHTNSQTLNNSAHKYNWETPVSLLTTIYKNDVDAV